MGYTRGKSRVGQGGGFWEGDDMGDSKYHEVLFLGDTESGDSD